MQEHFPQADFATELPGKVEVPRVHAEWPQSILFAICSPIAVMTAGKCPSRRQCRLIHLRSPSDKSMIHLLVSIFVFLPKCGAGLWPVWPASLADALRTMLPCQRWDKSSAEDVRWHD